MIYFYKKIKNNFLIYENKNIHFNMRFLYFLKLNEIIINK